MVQHDKLLLKLRAVGIDGDLLAWIKNWLSCRTFQTRVNDLLSAVCNLLTGVIQGSVLGPLIFLIYINDLVELLSRYNIKVKLFADDVKLYIKVVNEVDVVVFQEALTALFLGQRNGSCQWRLINVGCYKLVKVKCRLRSVLMTPHCLWLIHVARDLGVTISKDLSPSQYINDIVRK